MMKAFIGIDTSCYTTSVASLLQDGSVEADFRQMLEVPDGMKGLRQSDAVFLHLKAIPSLLEQLFEKTKGHHVSAICVSVRPRPLPQSYMPVFTAGKSIAKSLAASLSIPCIETSHQEGHLAAGLFGSNDIPERFLAMHVSGGTTEVLDVTQKKGGFDIMLLGGTQDISAGQLVDRTGMLLGCSFPCGKQMEFLTSGAERTDVSLPVSQRELFCSFSGAETAMKKLIASGTDPVDVCAAVFQNIAVTLGRLLAASSEKTGIQHALMVGGVMQNRIIRETLSELTAAKAPNMSLVFGPPQYCGDNAVGAAKIGINAQLRQERHP
jgi:N6-L-threonylcarbamoyladenine synthase